MAASKGLAANMFYVQNLPIYPAFSVLDVSWTLCLEVQFYLAYLLILVTAFYVSALTGRFRSVLRYTIVMLAVLILFAWSLIFWNHHSGVSFAHRSWMFFLGLSVSSLSQRVPIVGVGVDSRASAAGSSGIEMLKGITILLTAIAIFAWRCRPFFDHSGESAPAVSGEDQLQPLLAAYGRGKIKCNLDILSVWAKRGTVAAWCVWGLAIAASTLAPPS